MFSNIFVAVLVKSTHVYLNNVCKLNRSFMYIFAGSLHEMYLVSPLDTIDTFFSAMRMQ